MHMRFEDLRERLLRQGVALRHVRRYLSELQDHYDDAVQDELSRGASAATAEDAAWVRLGDPEYLAAGALARPELRSVLARHPRIIFGVGPLAVWIAAIVATICLMTAIKHVTADPNPNIHKAPAAWVNGPVQAAVFLYAHVLPIVLGALATLGAIRQRVDWRWPVVGVLLIAVVAAGAQITLTLPTDTLPGELQVGAGLFPGVLGLAAVNAALMLAPFAWRRLAARPR